MILSQQNIKYLLIVCVVVCTCYVLGAKEVRAHRAKWAISPRFTTCEQLVDFMNIQGVHDFFGLTGNAQDGYRVIFED